MPSKSQGSRKIYNTKKWKDLRLSVLREENYVCGYCGGKASQVDHIIELDQQPELAYERSNLVAACQPCNSRKGSTYQAKQAAQRRQRSFGSGTPSTPPPHLSISDRSFSDHSEPAPTGADVAIPDEIPPRLVTPTLGGDTLGGLVADWAAANLNIELYPWQRQVLDGMLEHDDYVLRHRWALVSTARQNGKTSGLLVPLIGWWLTDGRRVRGRAQNVINVAHKLSIAEDVFKQLGPLLKDRYGFKTYESVGRKEAYHDDGTNWRVEAGNVRAGHGTSNDLVICDEIWKLDADVVEAGLLPTQRAKPHPFALFVSTAGTEESKLFIRWRERGMQQIEKNEQGRLYMAEWSPPPNVSATDRQYWHMGNPAMGLGELTMQDLEDELEAPDRDNFMRSSLNLWTAAVGAWIPPQVWPALHTDDTMPTGGYLAVDSDSFDMRYCGVRVAARDDGHLQVRSEFVVESIVEMWDAIETAMADPDMTLMLTPGLFAVCPPELKRRAKDFGQREMATFTSLVRNLILEGRVKHNSQMALTEQVQRAVAGRTQTGITLSSQKSPGPIEQCRCMVAAAGFAAAPQAKIRRPMIGVAS